MMKLNFTLLFLFYFSLQNLQAQSVSQFKKEDSIIGGMGCSRGFSEDYRFKPKDINTYKHINVDFGKDIFQVYFKGKPLRFIDPNKTVVKYATDKDSKEAWYRYNNLFVTDGKVTYHKDILMKNVDTSDIHYMFDNRIIMFIMKVIY